MTEGELEGVLEEMVAELSAEEKRIYGNERLEAVCLSGTVHSMPQDVDVMCWRCVRVV